MSNETSILTLWSQQAIVQGLNPYDPDDNVWRPEAGSIKIIGNLQITLKKHDGTLCLSELLLTTCKMKHVLCIYYRVSASQISSEGRSTLLTLIRCLLIAARLSRDTNGNIVATTSNPNGRVTSSGAWRRCMAGPASACTQRSQIVTSRFRTTYFCLHSVGGFAPDDPKDSLDERRKYSSAFCT